MNDKFGSHLSDWGYSDGHTPPSNDRTIRLIKNASRGLIEYTSNTVQFIHETAREFFLTGPGLGILDARLAVNPLGLSYMALVTGCMNGIEQLRPTEKSLRDHCWRFITVYARSVEAHGGSNVALLDRMEGSVLLGALCRRGESILHFMSREHLTSCVLACPGRGMHPEEAGQDEYSTSPLLAAIGWSLAPDKALVEGLVNHGANLERRDENLRTPLLIALKNNWLDLAEIFLKHGANINATDVAGESALHILVVKSKIDPTPESATEEEARIQDIKRQYRALLDELLSRGADPNVRAFSNSTPLHFAAISGNSYAVKKLIEHGAALDLEDERGTPLLHAASCHMPEAAEICVILLDNFADPHYKNMNQMTALHHAARSSTASTVRQLASYGLDVNAVDKHGRNAVHIAAARAAQPGCFELLSALVEAGCSTTARDGLGLTPIQIAQNYHFRMDARIRALLEDGEVSW
ncbi:hypothetical protein MFIFM68171_03638 [Madurella fahalii]|uniref:Ankyrin n=1 Tax=Madurella fahalii TaxID=1157608 RepID=A0ABQ0G6N3_9PEZI